MGNQYSTINKDTLYYAAWAKPNTLYPSSLGLSMGGYDLLGRMAEYCVPTLHKQYTHTKPRYSKGYRSKDQSSLSCNLSNRVQHTEPNIQCTKILRCLMRQSSIYGFQIA